MQELKDTFYLMLRDRVAAANAGRTAVVRGAVRPGVLVLENELPETAVDGLPRLDVFCLAWTGLRVDGGGALPLTAATCEIRYATGGTSGTSGMDRGRALALMDAELLAALKMAPMSTAKVKVGAVADGTNVFWTEPAFGPAKMRGGCMERTVTVEVFCDGE